MDPLPGPPDLPLDPTGPDQRVEVSSMDVDVTAERGERDAPFRDQPTDESWAGTEDVGGLVDGE
jgi:hypothetical protein